jgi:hypothetical protein
MDLYVIRRPSAWANLQELEAAGAKSAKIGNEEMPASAGSAVSAADDAAAGPWRSAV